MSLLFRQRYSTKIYAYCQRPVFQMQWQRPLVIQGERMNKLEKATIEARALSDLKNQLMHMIVVKDIEYHVVFDNFKTLLASVDLDAIAVELEKSYSGNKE